MIQEQLQLLMQYINHHPNVGLVITFVTAFLESLALVGSIIPGVVTMTGIGVLVGSNILPASITLLSAMSGALLGDYISFWIGRYFKERLFGIWPFSHYPDWIHKGSQFFKKHGIVSVVIGRFFGPMRSMVPMVAGMLNMSAIRFTIAAIPSAILWSVSYMLPGIFLGALSMELPPKVALLFLVWSLCTLAFISLIVWLLERYCRKLHAWFDRKCQVLWHSTQQSHYTRWLIKCLARPDALQDYTPLRLLLGFLISLTLFILLLYQVMCHGLLTAWNVPIHHLLRSFHIDFIRYTTVVISLFGSVQSVVITTLMIVGWLLYRRYFQVALHGLIALVLPLLTVYLLKNYVSSIRPDDILQVVPTFSFPSGHITMTVVLFFFLTGLLAKRQTILQRRCTLITASLFIFLLAFSRLYLGAHWLTDAVGGLLLALALVGTVRLSCYHRVVDYPNPRHLLIVALLSWCIAGMSMTFLRFTKDAHSYQPIYRTFSHMSPSDWWQHRQQGLPLYRYNRFGKPIQPLNIQWLATRDEIVHLMKQRDWQVHYYPSQFNDFIHRLASWNTKYHLPLLPERVNGALPTMLFQKKIKGKQYLLLKLWFIPLYKRQHKIPLWVGSLTRHAINGHLFPYHAVVDTNTVTWFGQQLNPRRWEHYIVHIKPDPRWSKIQHLHWKGEILQITQSN